MNEEVKQLQGELFNVASVLRGYAAGYASMYEEEIAKNGENSLEAERIKAGLEVIQNVMDELGIEVKVNNYYFTFGSAKQYPYSRGQYVVVKAQNKKEAIKKYKYKYPNPSTNPDGIEIINCADYYDQKEWDERICKYYEGTAPAEVIE